MAKPAGASGMKRDNSKPSTVNSRKRKYNEMCGSDRKSRKKSHTSDDSSPRRKHGKVRMGKNNR